MKLTLGDIMNILMTWSDKSHILRKEIAKSGSVLLCTSVLQAGKIMYQVINALLNTNCFYMLQIFIFVVLNHS